MERISFGRSEDCDIIFDDKDKLSSRHHGYLQVDGDRVYVVDNESLNGIYVNGERNKKKTLLHPGDKVMVARKFLLDWKKYLAIDNDGTIWNDDRTSRFSSSIDERHPRSYRGAPAMIDIPSKMEINQNHAEVYRNGSKGADWKVPLKRNMGNKIGNAVGETLGCIFSIIIIAIFIAIVSILLSS